MKAFKNKTYENETRKQNAKRNKEKMHPEKHEISQSRIREVFLIRNKRLQAAKNQYK